MPFVSLRAIRRAAKTNLRRNGAISDVLLDSDICGPSRSHLPRALTLLQWIWYYIIRNVMESAMESAITVKGQATIPKAVRQHLGLKAGDKLKFFFQPDGSVALLPKLPAQSLRGIVRSRRRRPVTIDQMTRAAAEGASGGTSRAKRQ